VVVQVSRQVDPAAPGVEWSWTRHPPARGPRLLFDSVMSVSTVESGGIFISYRREDSGHLAGRLYDRLAERFGRDQVFIDVDTIEPGANFHEKIIRAVTASKVLLTIIGPAWVTAADERGRRLDNSEDPVRLEVQTALVRGVLIIPILADGAAMPRREDLPGSLAGLALRNALSIRYESFGADVRQLVTAIEGVPARRDFSQAARLLTDAEDVAGSVADETAKAMALGKVAEALAAIDPRRAERIADSLTREPPKLMALTGIAEALAATDPDRAALLTEAERIARFFRHADDQAWGLSIVAKALAASDPDRAARLFTEALPNVPSITSKTTLSRFAEALAATDPDRAERTAYAITTEDGWRAVALSKVAKTLAPTHPEHAARLLIDAESTADSITDKSAKAWARGDIAEALALIDPDRAEHIARSVTGKSWKAMALARVAEALAPAEPDRSARLFTDALRAVHSTIKSDEFFDKPALMEVVLALAASDPDRAERTARSISTAEWKAVALSLVAKVLAATLYPAVPLSVGLARQVRVDAQERCGKEFV
jgi:TIR domain